MLQVIPGMRYQDVERIFSIIPGNPTFASGSIKERIDTQNISDKLRANLKSENIMNIDEILTADYRVFNPSREDLLRAIKLNLLDQNEENSQERFPLHVDSVQWNFDKKVRKIIAGERVTRQSTGHIRLELPYKVSAWSLTEKIPEYVRTIMSEMEKGKLYIPEFEIKHHDRLTHIIKSQLN